MKCCQSYLGLGLGGNECDCFVGGIGGSLQIRCKDMVSHRLESKLGLLSKTFCVVCLYDLNETSLCRTDLFTGRGNDFSC